MGRRVVDAELRPKAITLMLDGESVVDGHVEYLVALTTKKGTLFVGGPGKARIPVGDEDRELSDALFRLVRRVTALMNEQAGLVDPDLELVEDDLAEDDQEL